MVAALRTLFLVGAMLALAGGAARAAPKEKEDAAVKQARIHFELGREYYKSGAYDDAIREFEAGYALVPKPAFLINLGQAYRQKGQLERAREMYEKYLLEVPPDDPERRDVVKILADIKQQEAPPPAPDGGVADAGVAPAPIVLAPVTPATPAPAAAERRPFIKRHWWIIPVAAVVAAGAAVGIYFAVKPSDCANGTVACLDLSR